MNINDIQNINYVLKPVGLITVIFVTKTITSFISKIVGDFREKFGENKTEGQRTNFTYSTSKIFGKNEGEYVDFEEIK